MTKYKIILFDGVCVLCNNIIQFIAKHDIKNQIKFAHLQSKDGKALVEKYQIKCAHDLSSIILIDKGKIYYKSSAILRIFVYFRGLWKTLYFFIIIPSYFRDKIYTVIGKRRYKWFGKHDKCSVPKNLLEKFDLSKL